MENRKGEVFMRRKMNNKYVIIILCYLLMMMTSVLSYGKVSEDEVVIVTVSDEEDTYGVTGVVVGEDGSGYYIITSPIVYEDEDYEVEVWIEEDESAEATIIYGPEDMEVDAPIAVIKTKGKDLNLVPVVISEVGIDEDKDLVAYGYAGYYYFDEDDTAFELEEFELDDIEEDDFDMDIDDAYSFYSLMSPRVTGAPVFDDDELVGLILESEEGVLYDLEAAIETLEKEGVSLAGRSKGLNYMYIIGGVLAVVIVSIIIWSNMKKSKVTKEQRVMEPANVAPQPQVVDSHELKPKKNYRLVGSHGYYDGAELVLDENTLTIGRDPNLCNLVYPNDIDIISRKHAEIKMQSSKGGYVIIDYSSRGTFVNKVKLTKNTPKVLHSGDEIYIADAKQSFRFF